LLQHGKQPLANIQCEVTTQDYIESTARIISEMLNTNRDTNITTTAHAHADTDTDTETILNNFSAATTSYIERASNVDLLNRIIKLQLTEEEASKFEKFKDFITNEYMNIPVILNDIFYDLETLLKLSAKSDGERKDPVNWK